MTTPTPPEDAPRTGSGQGGDALTTGQHAVPRVPPPPTGQVPVVTPPGPEARTEPPAPAAAPAVPVSGGDDDARTTDRPAPDSAPTPAPAPTPVPPQDGPRQDGPGQDGPGHDGPEHDRHEHDGPEHEEPHPSDRPERDRDAAALAAQRELRRREESLPQAPPRPGAGRHLLGVLVGLVLTPLALLLTGIGTARLADIAGTADMGTDALGVGLLVAGLLLLVVVVLLGVWSPAVPVTGGLVWGVALGVLALVLPGAVQDAVDGFTGDRVVPALVDPLLESAMSGELLVTGTVLVAAGLAAARARRKGRRWAEGVAAAEAARREQARLDEARLDQARLAEQRRTA